MPTDDGRGDLDRYERDQNTLLHSDGTPRRAAILSRWSGPAASSDVDTPRPNRRKTTEVSEARFELPTRYLGKPVGTQTSWSGPAALTRPLV